MPVEDLQVVSRGHAPSVQPQAGARTCLLGIPLQLQPEVQVLDILCKW